MRKITFIIAFFALVFSCSQKETIQKNDWFHDCLKGEVKTIEESYFGASGTAEKTEKGALSTKVIISYDKNGYRIENRDKIKVHFNAAGLKDTIINIDGNGVMESKFINGFNENNELIMTQMFDKNGNPVYTWKYEYDTNNCLIMETLYNAVGTQMSSNRFVYENDSKGNWIKKVIISEDSNEPLQVIERSITYY
ncbi:MAG: hypothetical protein LBR17_06920 [Bacteroidales bacterium]|jgi:hypothetical protein|nr:hypothetical protein [Bacteroidales bacterium]